MRHETFGRGISITTVSPGAAATGLYNLSPRYMKLGVRLGVIMKPEGLAALAVQKMFRRRAEYIPGGLINRLFILLVVAMPEALIRRIKRKIDSI
jgi:short-subunit dehydrogenase